MSVREFLQWNKQGEDAAGEMWVCRGGYARGRDPHWTWGRWTGVTGKNGLGGASARGAASGTATTLEEAKEKVAEVFGPLLADEVEALLAADEGRCRKCGEYKPLKTKVREDATGICFVCSQAVSGG